MALAAIQGFYQLSKEQAARIEELEAEKASLREQLDHLEARVAARAMLGILVRSGGG
jgi:Tfp pilus assembly protein PilO